MGWKKNVWTFSAKLPRYATASTIGCNSQHFWQSGLFSFTFFLLLFYAYFWQGAQSTCFSYKVSSDFFRFSFQICQWAERKSGECCLEHVSRINLRKSRVLKWVKANSHIQPFWTCELFRDVSSGWHFTCRSSYGECCDVPKLKLISVS